MLRAIGRILSATVAGLYKGTLGVLHWGEQLIRWPFSLVFGSGGGGRPNPHFEPLTSGIQLLDEFEESRKRQTAVQTLDRDGVDTVIKYAKALPPARSTIDLGGLRKDIRAILLTMDDRELQALAQAGIGAVRKFVDGKQHGIHGVPIVKPLASATEKSPRGISAEDRVLSKVRARILKAEQSGDFKLSM
ncbi:hypothetical protein ABIA25_002595 [Sinorhizobium fredii]|uniref:hypothetical protein n=1 Tax=Rhizobium fredii TaxID=380 RepID=UPI00138B1A2C|nr:hypothetical protein [Sinorhizobium fredii]